MRRKAGCGNIRLVLSGETFQAINELQPNLKAHDVLHPDDRVDTVMFASNEPSTSNRNNSKAPRSKASTDGDLFAPLDGQDNSGCRNRASDLRQANQASPNAYADASQPGSPRTPQLGAGQNKPDLTPGAVSVRDEAGGDRDRSPNPDSEPGEARRLSPASDESAQGAFLPFGPLMTDQQVANFFQVSRATIWRAAKNDPDFPKPQKFFGNSTRWYRCDIEEHLRQKKVGGRG